MKLRNKKTGEIIETHLLVVQSVEDPTKRYYTGSIKDLCDNYEDYTPAEPLIKDEKVRKAVRAWANADLIKKAYLEDDYTICANDDVNVHISFSLPVFKDVGGATDYTIAELCGEKEE